VATPGIDEGQLHDEYLRGHRDGRAQAEADHARKARATSGNGSGARTGPLDAQRVRAIVTAAKVAEERGRLTDFEIEFTESMRVRIAQWAIVSCSVTSKSTLLSGSRPS
jgi:hypothetical protein